MMSLVQVKHRDSERITAPARFGSSYASDFLIALVLIAATIAVYFPSLTATFAEIDDYMYVVDNDAVRNPSIQSVKRFFGEVLSPTTIAGYYQPLSMLSLMLDAWLGGEQGLDPFTYHLTNIIWHALNGVLVFVFFRLLVQDRIIAAFMAAVFLFHPVQVESVSWISQRKAVLATFFALASLIAYVRFVRTRSTMMLIWCAILFLLGNLAKPTVMPLPLIFVLLDIWPLRRSIIRSLPEKLVFVPIMLGFMYIAWKSQSSTAVLGAPKVENVGSLAKWAAYLSHNFMLYLGNIFWPVYLAPYRSIPTDWSLNNPAMLGSLIGTLAIIGLTILVLRRFTPFFVGMVGFVILLSPALGGVRFTATSIGDRFLYLPVVMLLLPFAEGLRLLPRESRFCRTALVALAVTFVCFLSWLNQYQQQVWISPKNMWKHIIAITPDLPAANSHAAAIAMDEGKFLEGITFARKAIEGEPSNAYSHHILGRLLTRTNQIAEARQHVERALALGLNKQQGWGYLSLAETWAAEGNVEQARNAVAQAISLGWNEAPYIAMVGEMAHKGGIKNCPIAIEFYHKGIDADPKDMNVRFDFAKCLLECGRKEDAIVQYNAFVKLASEGGYTEAYINQAAGELKRNLLGK